MELYYIGFVRMPTEKAHGAQIAKMCEAFALAGEQVTLVVPQRRTHITEDPFTYYGVKKVFTIVYLPVWDMVGWGSLGFLFTSIQFAVKAARYVKKNSADTRVYGRDELVLALLHMYSVRNITWESHTGSWNAAARLLAKKLQKIVVISQGLKDFYTRKGVDIKKLFVAHDGVDPQAFEHPESREAARTRLGLPQFAKIAMYIGSLGEGKGVETLCDAANLLHDIRVVIIGGEDAQVKAMQVRYPRVLFLGPHPYRELASNQAAADVLVVPNSGRTLVWSYYTSPLKLFAAMMSHVPIVASSVPSVREVLDDTSAYLVEPDNPRALASGIQAALGVGAQAKVEAARILVHGYYWSTRATHILRFISTSAV